MSLRRQLFTSFAVQGVGAASVLVATLGLGVTLGPQVQGDFSRTKTEIEFVAALAMFGLPQALFYYVKSGGLSLRQALRWAGGSTLLALPIGSIYLLLQHRDATPLLVALMAVAIAAGVAHGQLRALLLVQVSTVWFNFLTALPQLAVLVGVAWVIAAGAPGPRQWALVFALAFAVAASIALMRLWVTQPKPQSSHAGRQELASFGLAAWLTAALSTGAALLVQRWVEAADGAVVLGQFTTAMTLALVPLVPVAYAAPLLLRRWMERPDRQASLRWALGLFLMLLIVAATVGASAAVWPDVGLGAAYAGTTLALAVLLAAGAAEAATKLLTVQASARGLPWIAVRSELTRWVVLVAGWSAPLPPGLLPKCLVWVAASWAAALVFAWYTCSKTAPNGPMP